MSDGQTRKLCNIKSKTQALFLKNNYRYYSVDLTNFSNKLNSNSPFNFVDNFKIIDVKLIQNIHTMTYII